MSFSFKPYFYPTLITFYITLVNVFNEHYELIGGRIVLLIAALFLFIDVCFHVMLKQGRTLNARNMFNRVKGDLLLWDFRTDMFVTAGLLTGSVWMTDFPFLSLLMGLGTLLAVYRYWSYIGTEYKSYFNDPGGFV